MKLLRFDAGEGPRFGALKDEGIIDLVALASPYVDLHAVIAGGNKALDAISSLVDNNSPAIGLSEVALLAPISRPGKYLAIGMNYGKHAEEAARLGLTVSAKQTWFNKQITCLAGPYDPIETGVTEKLDYEVELGVVIGKRAKGVKASEALSHVFGYFVANDVSARDWQFHSPTITIGKSFDTHGPIGPWIVTADEIPDPQALDLRCLVNGAVRQSSNTRNMIHAIRDQIEYLSTAFTLEPGDLLATGTPDGVGAAMEPPAFLQPGDIVRCEIDGIGAIENRVMG